MAIHLLAARAIGDDQPSHIPSRSYPGIGGEALWSHTAEVFVVLHLRSKNLIPLLPETAATPPQEIICLHYRSVFVNLDATLREIELISLAARL